MNDKPLSPIEEEAMLWLQRNSSILVTSIPEKTEMEPGLGSRIPGLATFRRLESKGLCYMTEEDPLFPEDGPDSETWTPSVEITDLGKAWRQPVTAPCLSPIKPKKRASTP